MTTRRKAPGASAPVRIIPNKGRKLQVAPTSRRLFGEKAKHAFLEWFSATCNCSLAARKVGFHYRTVLRHWREDAAFGARCEETLRIGYARLEELALRGAEAALKPGGRGRRAVRGDKAAPPETLAMTPQDALQLLREHKRGLAGPVAGSGQARKPGRAPTVASNAEVFEALVKRLRAFGIRVEAEAAAPSPANAGEDFEGEAA